MITFIVEISKWQASPENRIKIIERLCRGYTASKFNCFVLLLRIRRIHDKISIRLTPASAEELQNPENNSYLIGLRFANTAYYTLPVYEYEAYINVNFLTAISIGSNLPKIP